MIGLIVATVGAVNVFWPKKVLYLTEFMIIKKDGKFVFATSEPNKFVILLHRIFGAFFLLIGIPLVGVDILDIFI
ncbi:hypothetical protein PALU110988_14315 [Paenibacillus lupini]|uniref:hypothetical protein n=1 Tax=Paenibacillus lupini TaxID=1450204 RepID=UPI00141F2491|nr:hypothetical protein [Paenibacillus lupini]NIK25062.1 hypothetical protein [Paenibacillus lupini]